MNHACIKAGLGVLAAAWLAAAPPAMAGPAAETALQTETVLISARGRPASQSDTPGGVGVATSAEIALAPKASLADALAQIPGVTASGDSAWGRDVSIRGLGGASVVVLVDGKRLNTATDINARLGFINPMDVERVEVLKGPVSSLYGSGSTGGVINIITRKGSFAKQAGLHGRASLGGVSNPAGVDAYGNVHYDAPDLWLLASVGARDHDDTRAGDDQRIPNSQFRDEQGRVAGAFKLGRKLTTEFQVLQTEAHDVGIPGGPGTLPAAARVTYPRTSSTLASLDASLDVGGEVVKEVLASLYVNRNQRRVLVDQNGVPAIREIRPGADHQTVGGKLQTSLEAGDHAVVAGVDAWTWHMESWRYRYLATGRVLSDFPVPDTRQTSMGVFAEDDWRLGNALTLNLGARLDLMQTRNEAGNGFAAATQDDTGWNVHAGLTWRPAKAWSHTLLAASSYRAADILERFKLIDLGGGQQLKGDPDLKPETSLFLEYGLHYQAGAVGADLRAFANTIYDYISQKRQSPTLLVMHNVGEARLYGAELEAHWRVAQAWTLFASLAGLEGRDESADEPLPAIAPVSGQAGVTWELGSCWARLDTRWALEQDQTPSGVPPVDGYATLNAAFRYRLPMAGLKHELLLTVDNILDESYENYLANSRGIELREPGIAAALTYTVEF
ncbi:MAG: TonB-dependent receptor [Pseudomonadota bacterium]